MHPPTTETEPRRSAVFRVSWSSMVPDLGFLVTGHLPPHGLGPFSHRGPGKLVARSRGAGSQPSGLTSIFNPGSRPGPTPSRTARHLIARGDAAGSTGRRIRLCTGSGGADAATVDAPDVLRPPSASASGRRISERTSLGVRRHSVLFVYRLSAASAHARAVPSRRRRVLSSATSERRLPGPPRQGGMTALAGAHRIHAS